MGPPRASGAHKKRWNKKRWNQKELEPKNAGTKKSSFSLLPFSSSFLFFPFSLLLSFCDGLAQRGYYRYFYVYFRVLYFLSPFCHYYSSLYTVLEAGSGWCFG
jgi:hypothetical protein